MVYSRSVPKDLAELPRRLAASLGAAVFGFALGCVERPLELEPSFADIHREPACMVLVGTHGYWGDGTHEVFTNVKNGGSLSACMCMSEEEFEKGERDEEIADLMLETCLAYSAYRGYAWDDCEEDRYDGEWMLFIHWWDTEGFEWAYNGLDCAPPKASDCALVGGDRGSAPTLGLTLALILLGLRRRESP